MHIYLTDDANRLVREHRLDLRAMLDHMERAAMSQQWTFHYALPLPRGWLNAEVAEPVRVPTLRFEFVEIAADDGVLWTATKT